MRNKSENTKTIETTFGQVTVFTNDLQEKKGSSKPPVKTSIEADSNAYNVKKVDRDVKEETEQNNDEDYFGIKKSELNFFDQEIVKSYEPSSLSPNKDANIRTNSDEFKEPLDFVDNQYFGGLTKTEKLGENSEKTVSKSDMKREFSKGANYIDEQILSEIDDESIGTIKDLKSQGSKKTNDKTSFPIIQSENLTAEKLKKTRIRLDEDKEDVDRKIESRHKLLASEVLDWNKITKDEAVKILKSHVCYHNEEEGLFGLDKPYGLPSKRGPGVHLCVAGLLPLLEEVLNLKYRLLMCNRLDENTTGVMLFATNSKTAAKIREYYDQNKVVKQYLAITKNVPESNEGEINIPLIRRSINGKYKTYLSPEYDEIEEMIKKPVKDKEERRYAVTKYRVLDSHQKAAFLEIQPQTGFTHQIRAHLAYGLGCPILGDHKYSHHVKMAPQKLPDEMLKLLKIKQSKVRYVPMNLHAYRVILPEFINASNVFIQAKIPLHFVNNLKRLKLKF